MRAVLGAALVSVAVAARWSVEPVVQSGVFGTTVDGCMCTAACGAVLSDGFTCDRCSVGSGCGRGNMLTGSWDYCDLSPIASFESQAFSAKIAHYEKELARNPQMTVTLLSTARAAANLARQSIHTTFDNYLPTMPVGRQKFIHTGGSVCRVDMTIRNSPYTGLLSRGRQSGFMRMGPASAPDSDGISPGWGFKFPRTGVPSGDFVAMNAVEAGQPFNFFARNISNKLSPVTGVTTVAARIFERATICANQVGISDLTKYSQAGQSVDVPKFPYKLFFQPTAETQTSDSPKTVDDIMDEFASFPVGMKLFTVYACDTPTDDESAPLTTLENCGSPQLLGDINLAGKCSVSDYGDREFHIRHQRIEEDWALRPDFNTGRETCGRSARDWNQGSPDLCKAAMLSSEP